MHDLPDPQRQSQFYANVPTKRFVAWVIDTAATLALCIVIVPFTAFTALFFLPFLFLVVNFLYRAATLAGGSATWGMRLAAIELRTAQGEKLDGTTALLHTAGYILSCAVPILQIISVAMMLTGARGQGLTDNVLGTVALNRRA